MATPPRSDGSKAEVRSAAEEARRQTEAAREKMSYAGQSAQHEAERLGRAAREDAWHEAERQKQAASESIDLQNPENRREIRSNDKRRAVFGKDKVTMFEMNKYCAQHLK